MSERMMDEKQEFVGGCVPGHPRLFHPHHGQPGPHTATSPSREHGPPVILSDAGGQPHPILKRLRV